MAHHLAYSSAAAVLGAGMYGYFRAGSKASLAGGALLSCAFVASGLATSQSTENIGSAFLVAAAAGAACTAIGARRWSRAQAKAGPAILLAVGVTNMAYYSMKAWEFREQI